MRKCNIEGLGEGVYEEYITDPNKHEQWNEYLLTNGSVVKVRTIVSGIIRIVGKKMADGQPYYFVKTTNVIDSLPPDSYQNKEGGVN